MELALVVTLVVVLWLWIDRANELFCLSWRDGELRLVRGRIPPALKRDLSDALAHLKATRATVKARRDATGVRLTASGVDEFGEQRLRNILQIYPMSQLRSATAPVENRLLRLLGFPTLLWLFGRRDD